MRGRIGRRHPDKPSIAPPHGIGEQHREQADGLALHLHGQPLDPGASDTDTIIHTVVEPDGNPYKTAHSRHKKGSVGARSELPTL
jgi:hypothetical protein